MLSESTYQELHRIWTDNSSDLGFDFFANLDIMGEFNSLGIKPKYEPGQSMNTFTKRLINKMQEIDDGKHGSRYLVDRALKELRIDSKIKDIEEDF